MHNTEPMIICIPHIIAGYINRIIDVSLNMTFIYKGYIYIYIYTYFLLLYKVYYTKDKKEVAIAFVKILLDAGQVESENDVLITAANILIDLSKEISYQNRNNPKKINTRFGQDTFIHQHLTPWIDNIFHREMPGFSHQ